MLFVDFDFPLATFGLSGCEMSSSEEDGVPDAPGQTLKAIENRAPHRCKVCRVPIKEHFGPHGEGKCALSVIAALRVRMEGLEKDLRVEQVDARDREQRLKTKIVSLEGQVREQSEQLDELKARLDSMADQLGQREKNGIGMIEKPTVQEGHITDPASKKARKKKRKSSEGEGEKKGKTFASASSDDDHDELLGTSTKVKVRTRLQHDKNSTKSHDGNMTPSERRAGEKSEKRMCVEPMPSDDESWSLISKQKPGPKRSVLYIGNLSPETTEERLVNFIQARSTAVGVKPPNIINARMFEPREGRDRIGARLTVASSDAEVLQATNFWPRPIYARAWNFHIVRLDKPQPLPLESHSNSSKRESGADLVSA